MRFYRLSGDHPRRHPTDAHPGMPAPGVCPQDSTTENAKNSHVSGIKATTRQASAHALPRHVPLSRVQTVATLSLLSSLGVAAPNWDCRSTPDGAGWQCEEVARPPGTQPEAASAGRESDSTAREDIPKGTGSPPKPIAQAEAPRPPAPARVPGAVGRRSRSARRSRPCP